MIVLLILVSTLLAATPYAITAYRYYSKSPQITHNYAAGLNAPVLAIPPDEWAWPRYRDILLKLNTELPPEFFSSEPYMSSSNPQAVREGAEWERIRHLLPLVREAAAMPKLGFVLRDQHDPADWAWIRGSDAPDTDHGRKAPSENPLMLSVLLPHFDGLRSLAKWLRFDARMAAERSDGGEAAADLIACFNIAGQVRQTPLLVADLVS